MKHTWLILVLFISGCAAKKPMHAKPTGQLIVVTKDCIVGWKINEGKCRPWKDELYLCDAVVVKVACIKIDQR
jgi:hypothetical protein